MAMIPVFHALKRKNEYKAKDLAKAVENANKQIEFSRNSIKLFPKHPKKGEATPVLDYARKFELRDYETLAPGKNKNLEKKKVPTIFVDIPDELAKRVKDKEFPDRSIGFKWRRESAESEPVPVITHVALLPEGHLPEIPFAEDNFEFEEDGLVVFDGKFDEKVEEFEADPEGKPDAKPKNEKPDNSEKKPPFDKSDDGGSDGGNKDENNDKEGEGESDDDKAEHEEEKQETVSMMMMWNLLNKMWDKIMAVLSPETDGGGDNLGMPLEDFESFLSEETFEAKLVDDEKKYHLTREQLKKTFKAAHEKNFEEFVASMIEISPSENFTSSVGKKSDEDEIITESDEEFEADQEPQRQKEWLSVESNGNTVKDNYCKAFPRMTENDCYKQYFKIK